MRVSTRSECRSCSPLSSVRSRDRVIPLKPDVIVTQPREVLLSGGCHPIRDFVSFSGNPTLNCYILPFRQVTETPRRRRFATARRLGSVMATVAERLHAAARTRVPLEAGERPHRMTPRTRKCLIGLRRIVVKTDLAPKRRRTALTTTHWLPAYVERPPICLTGDIQGAVRNFPLFLKVITFEPAKIDRSCLRQKMRLVLPF